MHRLSSRELAKMLAAAPVAALPASRRALAAEPWSMWTAVPGFGTTIDAPAAVGTGGGGGLYSSYAAPKAASTSTVSTPRAAWRFGVAGADPR